jgi:hypothetical protein
VVGKLPHQTYSVAVRGIGSKSVFPGREAIFRPGIVEFPKTENFSILFNNEIDEGVDAVTLFVGSLPE